METIGYLEKFYIYKVASLPLEVTLRHWYKYETKQIRNAYILFGKAEGRRSDGDRDTWENIKSILMKQNARM
jgi:hypothetical protein